MTKDEFDRDQFITWEQSSRDTIDVKKVYIDMVDGNLVAGLLLSQIVYWHLPAKSGKSKLRVYREGHPWLAKTYADLWKETRITKKMAGRAYGKLVARGLIEKRVWKFGGAPSVHVRICWPEFLSALSEVTKGHNSESLKVTVEDDQRAQTLTESPSEIKAKITEGDDDHRRDDAISSSSLGSLRHAISQAANLPTSHKGVIKAALSLEAKEWVTPELVALWTERFWPEQRPSIAEREAPWPVQLEKGIPRNRAKLLEAEYVSSFWN